MSFSAGKRKRIIARWEAETDNRPLGSVFDDDFHGAYTYRDSLVVFLDAKSMDNEGTKITLLVVTGTLRLK